MSFVVCLTLKSYLIIIELFIVFNLVRAIKTRAGGNGLRFSWLGLLGAFVWTNTNLGSHKHYIVKRNSSYSLSGHAKVFSHALKKSAHALKILLMHWKICSCIKKSAHALKNLLMHLKNLLMH